MRRIQKIFTWDIPGRRPALRCRGAGTALVEYSSFTYAGEKKKIGWEDLETKNLDFHLT